MSYIEEVQRKSDELKTIMDEALKRLNAVRRQQLSRLIDDAKQALDDIMLVADMADAAEEEA